MLQEIQTDPAHVFHSPDPLFPWEVQLGSARDKILKSTFKAESPIPTNPRSCFISGIVGLFKMRYSFSKSECKTIA